ncbi:hypothetical protein IQ254_12070 [Nodosilinea sp. LEGE 07088]|uniref:hypothetical protein n=1 Tax=Nodosilinea sp. LEGE 07088 TaxID=2777968 RepID=UPI001881BA3E|nr:hypothetical protein [Nodosilinea sp. LEGE 07088]MBE9137920.1 hypothetical protein [Nodosilinea sp. LEGE 07088]
MKIKKHLALISFITFVLVFSELGSQHAHAQEGPAEQKQPSSQVVVQIIATGVLLAVLEPWIIPRE